jgi:metal-responsive CopG/Arc/MetJ family transcriptional regulator
MEVFMASSKTRKSERIILTIHPGLLEMVDEAAKKEFSSRSDVIRTALLWYLQPDTNNAAKTDPDSIYNALHRRRMRAEIRKYITENPDIDAADS